MFASIFSFEVRRLVRTLSTYVYFLVLVLVTFFVALLAGGAIPEAKFDTAGEKIFANSPLVIDAFFGQINNYIGLIILVAMVGNAVLKDFKFNTYTMIFTTPVSRFNYLLGRFSGSMLIAILVLSGPAFGLMLGYASPWVRPERVEAFMLAPYIYTYLHTVIPNAIVFGTIFFSVSLISRDIFVIWLSLIVFFVANGVASSMFGKLEHQSIAALADPMGNFAKRALTKYWSTFDKNARVIPLSGYFLTNRLLWLGIAAGIWALGYSLFSFSAAPRRISFKKVQPIVAGKLSFIPSFFRRSALPDVHPVYTGKAMFAGLWNLAVSECRTLLRNVYFRIIILFGMLLLFVASLQLGQLYETTTFPVTYIVAEQFGGTFTLFIVILTILFGGELVWRDREMRMSNIIDALPVPNWVFFLSKLIGLMFMQVLLVTVIIVCGILVQLSKGYTHLELGVYAKYLYGFTLPDMLMLAVMSVFVQTLVRNKFLGYFIVSLFYFWNSTFAILVLKHSLFVFGSNPTVIYSEMNHFGHLTWPFFVFKLYWGAFCIMLAALSSLLWARGTERSLKQRLADAMLKANRRSWMLTAGSLVVFIVCGGFIYYNTNTLNHFRTSYQDEELQVQYEKQYGKFKDIPQPRITGVKLDVDIFPERRALYASGTYMLQNKTGVAIDSIHVMVPENILVSKMALDKPGKLVLNDSSVAYRIYKLEQPLQPGDSTILSFNVRLITKGFTHNFMGLGEPLENGTFVNNTVFLPSIGYNSQFELSGNNDRKKHGLGYRATANAITDTAALQRNLFTHDADFITFEATVSTSADQVAVAPGYLQREWTDKGRRYFHYKMDSKIMNFFSFLSARYKVKKDKWNDVNIEIYYQQGHEYNLDRMIHGIKQSLAYYTPSFSNYQHKQVRILEFPRYSSFAQSFPNTIPFSEGIGFIADISDTSENKVDYPFYVTAHEVAHQWFAHQVVGGDVEGSNVLSESLAQYGAISVLEREYGEEKLRKFLKIEMDNYLRSRSSESEKEKPWAFADAGQGYILYQKGGIQMHALGKYLGEDSLNLALKRFIQKYGFQGPPYPSTLDLISSIRAVTPDSMQYFVTDAFEKITIYDNKLTGAKVRKDGAQTFVDLTVNMVKNYADSTGKETRATGDSYVEIAMYRDRKTMDAPHMYILHPGENKLSIPVEKEPYKVVLDPRVLLIDRKLDDNEQKIGKDSPVASATRKSAVKVKKG
ncbi:MAG: ABC transporter permease [Taibaiella sp.]|nr:ABC transporter permease [Taibaiella sp.]